MVQLRLSGSSLQAGSSARKISAMSLPRHRQAQLAGLGIRIVAIRAPVRTRLEKLFGPAHSLSVRRDAKGFVTTISLALEEL
ncbi:MAG TPA: hypothetical protein VF215_13940 [Thermoanaerobaculia bacterium]